MRFLGLTACIFALLQVGCASQPVPSVAASEEAIDAMAMTCSKPYVLTQDCSIWSGATRQVALGSLAVRVAGSADGRVILVMDPNMWRNDFRDFMSMTKATHSTASTNSYFALRRHLDSKGVTTTRVRALTSPLGVRGYVVELDKNGYETLP